MAVWKPKGDSANPLSNHQEAYPVHHAAEGLCSYDIFPRILAQIHLLWVWPCIFRCLPQLSPPPPFQYHCHGPVALVPHANSRSILIINRKSVTTRCVWISYRRWNIGSMFKMKYSNVMMLTQWRASLSGEKVASKKLSVYHRVQYGSIHAVDTLTDKENILSRYLYASVRTNSHAKGRGRSNERGCTESTIWPESNEIIGYYLNKFGARCWWRSWLRHCTTSGKFSVRFPMVSLKFFIDIILAAALWRWSWLSL